ncbi:MAG: hypothetical protein ACI35R_15465 [Bacillus sp. (in: firmicutes)]
MKKFSIMYLLLLLIFSSTGETKAMASAIWPAKQSSEQWSVEIDKSKQTENSIQGHSPTYSLQVTNIGDDVVFAKVHMFRNAPGSATKYALFDHPRPAKKEHAKEDHKKHFAKRKAMMEQLNSGKPLQFPNFSITGTATEVEVEIIWAQKGSEGKLMKERFIFPAK